MVAHLCLVMPGGQFKAGDLARLMRFDVRPQARRPARHRQHLGDVALDDLLEKKKSRRQDRRDIFDGIGSLHAFISCHRCRSAHCRCALPALENA